MDHHLLHVQAALEKINDRRTEIRSLLKMKGGANDHDHDTENIDDKDPSFTYDLCRYVHLSAGLVDDIPAPSEPAKCVEMVLENGNKAAKRAAVAYIVDNVGEKASSIVVISDLIRLMGRENENESDQEMAIRALSSIGPPSVPALMAHAGRPFASVPSRLRALKALSHMKKTPKLNAVCSGFRALFRDTDPEIRMGACEAAGHIVSLYANEALFDHNGNVVSAGDMSSIMLGLAGRLEDSVLGVREAASAAIETSGIHIMIVCDHLIRALRAGLVDVSGPIACCGIPAIKELRDNVLFGSTASTQAKVRTVDALVVCARYPNREDGVLGLVISALRKGMKTKPVNRVVRQKCRIALEELVERGPDSVRREIRLTFRSSDLLSLSSTSNSSNLNSIDVCATPLTSGGDIDSDSKPIHRIRIDDSTDDLSKSMGMSVGGAGVEAELGLGCLGVQSSPSRQRKQRKEQEQMVEEVVEEERVEEDNDDDAVVPQIIITKPVDVSEGGVKVGEGEGEGGGEGERDGDIDVSASPDGEKHETSVSIVTDSNCVESPGARTEKNEEMVVSSSASNQQQHTQIESGTDGADVLMESVGSSRFPGSEARNKFAVREAEMRMGSAATTEMRSVSASASVPDGNGYGQEEFTGESVGEHKQIGGRSPIKHSYGLPRHPPCLTPSRSVPSISISIRGNNTDSIRNPSAVATSPRPGSDIPLSPSGSIVFNPVHRSSRLQSQSMASLSLNASASASRNRGLGKPPRII